MHVHHNPRLLCRFVTIQNVLPPHFDQPDIVGIVSVYHGAGAPRQLRLVGLIVTRQIGCSVVHRLLAFCVISVFAGAAAHIAQAFFVTRKKTVRAKPKVLAPKRNVRAKTTRRTSCHALEFSLESIHVHCSVVAIYSRP